MKNLTPCDVEIRIAADGTLEPLRFTVQGAWKNVAQVGRNWSDGLGDHWLVMPSSGEVYDLARSPDGLWRISRASGPARYA